MPSSDKEMKYKDYAVARIEHIIILYYCLINGYHRI